ncbi:hypothetical protein DIPPA_24567, partial [Diplonema papillatum]
AEQHLYDILKLCATVSTSAGAANRLASFFMPPLRSKLETAGPEAVFYIQCFAIVLRSVSAKIGSSLKAVVFAEGFPKLVEIVKSGAEKPTDTLVLPATLSLLESLVKGYNDCEVTKEIAHKLLETVKQLHALERKASKQKQEVTQAAAGVLDTLLECGKEGQKVEDVRKKTKKSKHNAAMALREKVLRDLNKKAQAGIDLEDVADEESLSCLICREPATFKLQDVLGIYVFSRRVEITTNTAPPDSGCTLAHVNSPSRAPTYSCVTHFNAIHFSCHREAVQIDASMRPPKREWDGATVRNLKTRCNAILPLKVEDTNAMQYHRVTSHFMERVGLSPSRGQLTPFEQSVYDCRMMIARSCWGHSYSADSNGGGPEHNFSLLPLQVQISLHFLDVEGAAYERPRAASLLNQFIAGAATPFLFHIEASSPPALSSEFVFYLLTVSLHTMSFVQWQENKYTVIRNFVAYLLSTFCTRQGRSKPLHLLYGDLVPPAMPSHTPAPHAAMTGLGTRSRLDDYEDDITDDVDWVNVRGAAHFSPSTSSIPATSSSAAVFDVSTDDGLFEFLKAPLAFLCVVDALHKAFKEDDKSLPDQGNLAVTSSSSALWVTSFAKRLAIKQVAMVDRCKEVREMTRNEFLASSSLLEMLEILEVLPFVLAEASTPELWAAQFLP